MTSLRNHCDGPGVTQKKRAKALADLEKMHCKGELSLPFDSFVTKLQAIFCKLAVCGGPKEPEEQIEIMCDKIQNTDSKLVAAVQFIGVAASRDDKPSFIEAANILSQEVAKIFPHAPVGAGRGKCGRVGSTRSGGRKRKGGGSGGGRGGGGDDGGIQPGMHPGKGVPGRPLGPNGGRNGWHDGTLWENGIDIKDLCRHYSTNEYKHLSDSTRRVIANPPDPNHPRNKRRKGGGSNRSVGEVSLSADTIQQIAAVARESDGVSAMTTETPRPAGAGVPNPAGGSAGVMFGRGAHGGGVGGPVVMGGGGGQAFK